MITRIEDPESGRISIVPTARPEKTQSARDAEIVANRIRRSDLLREMQWDEADLAAAAGFGFPVAVGHIGRVQHLAVGASALESEPFWLRSQIADWRERLLKLAAKMR